MLGRVLDLVVFAYLLPLERVRGSSSAHCQNSQHWDVWPSGYGARFKRSKASLSNEFPGNVSCVGSNPTAFIISFALFVRLLRALG